MNKFYYLGKANTKEEFSELFQNNRDKAKKFDKFVIDIGNENPYLILLNSPKIEERKWKEISDNWEKIKEILDPLNELRKNLNVDNKNFQNIYTEIQKIKKHCNEWPGFSPYRFPINENEFSSHLKKHGESETIKKIESQLKEIEKELGINSFTTFDSGLYKIARENQDTEYFHRLFNGEINSTFHVNISSDLLEEKNQEITKNVFTSNKNVSIAPLEKSTSQNAEFGIELEKQIMHKKNSEYLRSLKAKQLPSKTAGKSNFYDQENSTFQFKKNGKKFTSTKL